ncbi:MAG: PorV/PorQ family protein [Bacteroidota bacterium]|jgi:hypothetical protein|nr:PorV/PorQ family protein [Bacteroidota bacterium]GDX47397.1 hypothetical protein LBMAG25_02150 [Bacteroidota bacterium]
MKRILVLIIALSNLSVVIAGNKDRAGQAGAYELLINPWGRSSGWNGLNTSTVRGFESLNQNVAGLAFTKKTEIGFAHTNYLTGTGININALGLAQSVGKSGGVIGVSVVAMTFGEIQVTTTQNPEGGVGFYRPQFLNIALAYSKIFSKSIYGGFVVRGISESVSDISATGLALDAGIQYQTGTKKDPEKIKFGIALRNIGTPMRFRGDALSFKGTAPEGTYPLTIEKRSQQFELPSMLNIGLSYDFKFGGADATKRNQRLTLVGHFTSNSFYRDQIGAGAEYAFKEQFMIRGGYNYQQGLLNSNERSTAFTGLSGGITIDLPTKKGGPNVAFDYSYRTSNPWGGTHTVGVRINL